MEWILKNRIYVLYVTVILVIAVIFGIFVASLREKEKKLIAQHEYIKKKYQQELQTSDEQFGWIAHEIEKLKQENDSLEKVVIKTQKEKVQIQKEYGKKIEDVRKLPADASVKFFMKNTGTENDSVLQYRDSTRYIVGISNIRTANVQYLQRNQAITEVMNSNQQISLLSKEITTQELLNSKLTQQNELLKGSLESEKELNAKETEAHEKTRDKLKNSRTLNKVLLVVSTILTIGIIVK